MLLDANIIAEVPGDLSSELVIVGAGTAGLFLAAVLAETKGRSIIVLDAGPKVASTSMNSTTAASVGKPHNGVHFGRAAGLGGTSSLWGGQLAEFSQDDFWRHGAIWPLTFDELQKYYRVVYQRLGLGIPRSAAFYRQRFGREMEDGRSVERFFTYWLDQPNFATFYQKMIKSDPSIRVVVNLTANGCEFDGTNARALLCTTNSGRHLRVASDRFVFASGTLATNRFFLSTQRFGGVPWVHNGNIGRYFQDHLGGPIAKASVLDDRKFRDHFENGWVNGIKLEPKLALAPARQRSLQSGACVSFTYHSNVGENLHNLKRTIRGFRAGLTFSSFRSRAADAVVVGRSLLPLASRYVRSRRIFALFDQGLYLNVQAEQIPIARSRIRLASADKGVDGLIPIEVDWQCDGNELSAIRELASEAGKYLRTRGLAEISIDPAVEGQDSSFIERLSDTFHQCGGMRMSTSPANGVVDGDCRVWGTSNVWIAGAAVFPSSSHANCTLTALALTARSVPRLQ